MPVCVNQNETITLTMKRNYVYVAEEIDNMCNGDGDQTQLPASPGLIT